MSFTKFMIEDRGVAKIEGKEHVWIFVSLACSSGVSSGEYF